jgi:hypothetical protein
MIEYMVESFRALMFEFYLLVVFSLEFDWAYNTFNKNDTHNYEMKQIKLATF